MFMLMAGWLSSNRLLWDTGSFHLVVPLSSGLEVTPRVIQLVDMEEASAKNVDDQMPDT